MTDPRLSERWTVETRDAVAIELFRMEGYSADWNNLRHDHAIAASMAKIRATAALQEIARLGLLLKPGGVSRQIWRVCRGIESPGSIICHTREDADRWMRREPNSPWQDEGSPQVLEMATKTEWPDGSEYTSKWEPVGEVG